jgi:4-amino-4-deoxy-L-arabinose transferase-like glycosyltransferase
LPSIFYPLLPERTIYFAGLTARELGGGRIAQWFAALTMLTAPYLLTINSAFTYDPFDQLCTIILFYLVVRIINEETPKKWLLLGIVAGIGVMTKLSMLFTCGALTISLLVTSRQKSFLTVWPWLAALIAAFVGIPYLVWQSVHGWPLITYWHNYALENF